MEKSEYQVYYLDQTQTERKFGGVETDYRIARKLLNQIRHDSPKAKSWMKMRLVGDWCYVKEGNGSNS